mmetsp:Transcript_9506/g.27107  ORF Transcript_9506/g.27107 Transcript_9506/m.27107 type:complete len:233 (+) Transcript_9506:127-825(+)
MLLPYHLILRGTKHGRNECVFIIHQLSLRQLRHPLNPFRASSAHGGLGQALECPLLCLFGLLQLRVGGDDAGRCMDVPRLDGEHDFVIFCSLVPVLLRGSDGCQFVNGFDEVYVIELNEILQSGFGGFHHLLAAAFAAAIREQPIDAVQFVCSIDASLLVPDLRLEVADRIIGTLQIEEELNFMLAHSSLHGGERNAGPGRQLDIQFGRRYATHIRHVRIVARRQHDERLRG